MIFIVLFILITAPLLVMGTQGSITIGEQQIDFTVKAAQFDADSSLHYGCCGSGNGSSD